MNPLHQWRSTLVCRLAAGLLVAASSPKPHAAPPHQPNVVMAFIDDLGWGDFSCFGN
ncbi:MAG TPA: hypothetical protein P5186_01430 [Candidatus Paceibacterota bacterium]|nr:hypothetical protein [Verrucomicrobiota bacterium]HRY46683.1 hypothetical protein [Candidatus Paceibacterota bacterium]